MAKRKLRYSENKQAIWRGKIQSQGRSGLSVRAFCRQQHISEPTFYHWRRELARRRAAIKPKAVFVPVRITADSRAVMNQTTKTLGHDAQAPQPGPAGAIEILLAQGYRVRLSGPVDAAALGQVLSVLEGRP